MQFKLKKSRLKLKKEAIRKRNKTDSSKDPSTLSAPQVQSTGASKNVIARNVAIVLQKSDVIAFFKKCGEVLDVVYKDRGGTCCCIEFATEEAANKALELDGQCLGNREVVVSPEIESTGASKTLAAKNLPSSATKSDVIEFFKQAGEIVDVRFPLRLKGFCSIEFATEEAAKKTVELNGECLLDHPIVLGFARETIFVQGFDPSLNYDQVRSSLEEFFSACGEILRMEIPTVHYTSVPKGMAVIEFYDIRAFHKALAMNGHKLGDFTLTVEDAVPLQFNARPPGARRRINGRPVGPYNSIYPYRYFPHRGYGGAGIGKDGGIYHLTQGKKTTFDDD
ncbi:hypothetical protein MKW94_001434 [Papaver nudicaule]|uniref:RRM domain-containing protein n=1 Tax=Papaver nudicaule TaxID=74823 RepID=A0AA41VZ37_PAPNU|nr:hypothetical protein [Papaver nudicaule]